MPRLKVRRLLPGLLLSPLLLAIQCLRFCARVLPRPVHTYCRYLYYLAFFWYLHPDLYHPSIHARASVAAVEDAAEEDEHRRLLDEEIMSIYKDKAPAQPGSQSDSKKSHKWSTRKRWIVAAAVFFALGLTLAIILLFTLPGALPDDIPGPGGSGSKSSPTPTPSVPPPAWTGGYPNPENMVEGSNIPNNTIYQTLDPTIIRRASDGRVFLFTTGGDYGTAWEAPSLHGPWNRTSENLFGEKGGAPSVHSVDGDYYMFHNSHGFDYAAAGVENKAAQSYWHGASIKVQSSSLLDPGSWTTHGRLNITWDMRYNILDPALLTQNENDMEQVTEQNSNKHMLMFGSYQTGLFTVPLTDPPVELAPGAMEGLRHLEHNTTMYGNHKDRTEASYPYRNGKWNYLFFSSGRCCRNHEDKQWPAPGEEYKMMVCRTDKDVFTAGGADGDGDSSGDYFDKEGRNCRTDNGGTIVIESHGEVFAPGGGGVYDDSEEGVVIYYHYLHRNEGEKEPTKGYRFGWNKLEFDDDGWPKLVSS